MCLVLKQKPLFWTLLAATAVKAALVFFIYQNLIQFKNGRPGIVPGYGWNQLVDGLHGGKYEMTVQSGLSDILDLRHQAYRPPLYALFLFGITMLGPAAAAAGIILQSLITTLVAYAAYRIVHLATRDDELGQFCLWAVFFFPFNFIKSGVADEAPLMLLFLLLSAWIFLRYLTEPDRTGFLLGSAALLGLATLTRYVALFVAGLWFLLILVSRKAVRKPLLKAAAFAFIFVLILSPWVVRNVLVIGKPVLSTGSGRLFLATQSEVFIRDFPRRSMDDIEREFFRAYQKGHPYLSSLDALALDEEFTRLAKKEMRDHPGKFLRSLLVKLKPLLPLAYYPQGRGRLQNIFFVLSSTLILGAFLFSLALAGRLTQPMAVMGTALAGLLAPAIVHFILSRHLYPPMVMMIIMAFLAWPLRRKVK